MPNLKETVKSYLPPALRAPLIGAYKRLRPVRIEPGPATVYANIPEARTYIGINNFCSWLSADKPVRAKALVDFYDPDGKFLFQHVKKMEHFGAHQVDVKKVLEDRGVKSDFGVYSVQVVPLSRWNKAQQKMISLTTRYYMMWRFSDESVSIIHPNGRLGTGLDSTPGEWFSLQMISTHGVKELRLWQMFLADVPQELTYTFYCNDTGRIVHSERRLLKPRSANLITFSLAGISDLPAVVRLKTSAHPPHNGKPLLERIFTSGRRSVSHA